MKRLWTARRELTLAAAFVAFAASALATENDDQIVEHVHQAVVRHHLYAKPDCMKYRIIRNLHPRVDEVDVFERHDGRCGGDPGTEPRLFSFIVDRQTGELATTALDPDRLHYVRVK